MGAITTAADSLNKTSLLTAVLEFQRSKRKQEVTNVTFTLSVGFGDWNPLHPGQPGQDSNNEPIESDRAGI